MSDEEQWERDEQRAMETEIISLREQVEKLTKERNAFQDQCIRLKNERAVEKGQLSALAGQIRDDAEVRNAIMSELDNWQPKLGG